MKHSVWWTLLKCAAIFTVFAGPLAGESRERASRLWQDEIVNNSGKPTAVRFPLGDDPWRSVALVDLMTGKTVKRKECDADLELEPWDARLCRVVR